MTKRMTPAEIESGCKTVAGHGGHGWQRDAERKLGVSARTIREAVKPGARPSLKLEDAIRREIDNVITVSADELQYEAGAWSIGTPERKSGDQGVFSEVIVTHIATPAFVAHYEQRYGKTADGKPVVNYRVKWFDSPSSERVRKSLIETARGKAEEALGDMQQRSSDAMHRERTIRNILRRSGELDARRGKIEERDLRALTSCALRYHEITLDAVDYRDAIAALDNERRRILEIADAGWITGDGEREPKTRNEKRMWDMGKRYGALDVATSLLRHIEAEDVSEMTKVAAATLTTYMPRRAQADNVRGRNLSVHYPPASDAELREALKEEALKDPVWAARYDEVYGDR